MLTRGTNPRRRRDAAAGTIKLLEKRVGTLELKEELTKGDVQSILRMSKLLGDVSNDFKAYHFAIMDHIESDQDAEAEQETLDQHETKVMELIDRIGELIKEPSEEKKDSDGEFSTPRSSEPPLNVVKDQIVDRQLDVIEGSVLGIQRDLGKADLDVPMLVNYMDKIKRLEGKLEGLEKELLSLDDFGRRLERASEIERTLFGLRVKITRLMEQTKKEPSPKVVEPPLMAGVNLPRIEIPKFDSNILNWRSFWEQFQAAVHDKPQLSEVDKLTYLRDAVKGGPAMYVISGLTQTAESYGEAIQCLKDCYNRP